MTVDPGVKSLNDFRVFPGHIMLFAGIGLRIKELDATCSAIDQDPGILNDPRDRTVLGHGGLAFDRDVRFDPPEARASTSAFGEGQSLDANEIQKRRSQIQYRRHLR